MKELYIRADVNEIIATGHLMRCLAIADAARLSGIKTTFIMADDNGLELISSRGYNAIVLNTRWDDLDSEIDCFVNIIHEMKIEKLLVDSYKVTEKYLRELAKTTEVTYIDDLCEVVCPVQKLICYSKYWGYLNYEEKYTRALKENKINRIPDWRMGVDYVPLRTCFSLKGEKIIKSRIETVLIMSGGTDRYGVIDNILSKLEPDKYNKIIAICGRYYPKFDMIKEKYPHVEFYQNVTNIEVYMEMADVVISAGGTTIYELCAIGTPTIMYTIADNQIYNAERFDEEGIIAYAGDFRIQSNDVVDNIIKILNEYESDVERRRRSEKMKIDGDGAMRIVNYIMSDL